MKENNGEETYTFIVGASFGDKTYKSLISFTLRQCIDYCKECGSNKKCYKCLYAESKSYYCPSKNFSNLKFINIIIAAFIIAQLLLSLLKIIPWYSYINACNHYHSMLFILFLSVGNYNSISYFNSFLCILSPYFSPLIILNLINQHFKEIIISERGLMVYYFDGYLNPADDAVYVLLFKIILSCPILYFVFIIIKLCTKQHFMKYSKAMLDNSSIYYSIINFMAIFCAYKSSDYISYHFFDNNDYTIVLSIFSLFLLATVSLSNYSAYIDLKYALKAYILKAFVVTPPLS